ncbi:MAG: DinB family protein [Caldilinea sp.]|uniref:DinB family protein n=1 Tax=Caldilinea sp. TaxID=2293560 RepID=UPI0030A575E2
MTPTSELATYRRMFDAMVNDIELLLEDLPAKALLWKPFEHSPWRGPAGSLGWLIAHAISSTYYLLRRAEWMMGRLDWSAVDGDEGGEEFGPANHDPAYLLARARRMQLYVHQFLDSLSPQDLEASRPHPLEPGRVLTARYDIQHAFEHMSRHIGHAELTRQLWALKAAPPENDSSLQ